MSRWGMRIRNWMSGVDRSVTPIIATILIVALVVVIAASFGAVAFGFTDKLGETEVTAGSEQCLQTVGFDPGDVDSFADEATADLKCVMWFDANQEGFTDGESVDVWNDQSPNDFDATSPENPSGTTPTASSDVAGTGIAGVVFDGNNDALNTDATTSDANLDGQSEFTVITVVRANGADGAVLNLGRISKDPFAFGPDPSATDEWFIAFIDGYEVKKSWENWIVKTHVYDGGNKLKTYTNGELKSDRDITERVISDHPIEIGRFNYDPTDTDEPHFEGAISELIIFNQAVTEKDRKIIECSINDKYGGEITVKHC